MARFAVEIVLEIPERFARLLPPGGPYELDCLQSFRVLPILLEEIDLSQSGPKRDVEPAVAVFESTVTRPKSA